MSTNELLDPMPLFLTIEQVAKRWSNKFNIGADCNYVLDCYPELTFYDFTLMGKPIKYSRGNGIQEEREHLNEKLHGLSALLELHNFEAKLPEYEMANLKVRRDDLLLFETSFKAADLEKARKIRQTQRVEDTGYAKSRKKLIPKQRDTNEGLLLIYELVEKYNVHFQDDLLGPKAWGVIVSGEFTSALIKNISDAKKQITLNGGEKLTRESFLDKYRKRFK